MKWTNSYRSFGLKTKRSTGLKTIEHKQRGGNENRNGMIRRYLPKRCEIRMDMAKEVREIVDEINNRPMRVLGYRTPAEAFADELLELQDQQGCCTSK